MDNIQMPNVLTAIKIGQLKVEIFAFRRLSRDECQLAIKMHMRQCKLKQLPKSGKIKIISTFGSDL